MDVDSFSILFDLVGLASAALAGEKFTPPIDKIELSIKNINEGYYMGGHAEVIKSIEDKLNLCQDKELYILNVLKKFNCYKYLNTTLDTSEEQKAGLLNSVSRINAAHDLIKKHQQGGNIDTEDLPGFYLITCWGALNHFMKRIDTLAQNYNVDILDLQQKNNVNIWYRVSAGKVVTVGKSKTARPKLDDAILQVFNKAIGVGLIEQNKNGAYQWKSTKLLLAYFSEKVSNKLGLGKRRNGIATVNWKLLESIFNVKNIKSAKNDYMRINLSFFPDGCADIDKLFL